MTHLSAFVAASPSSQQRDSRQLDRLLAEFSAEEIQRLAVKMPEKRITLCEDETFHPDICMVTVHLPNINVKVKRGNFLFLNQECITVRVLHVNWFDPYSKLIHFLLSHV